MESKTVDKVDSCNWEIFAKKSTLLSVAINILLWAFKILPPNICHQFGSNKLLENLLKIFLDLISVSYFSHQISKLLPRHPTLSCLQMCAHAVPSAWRALSLICPKSTQVLTNNTHHNHQSPPDSLWVTSVPVHSSKQFLPFTPHCDFGFSCMLPLLDCDISLSLWYPEIWDGLGQRITLYGPWAKFSLPPVFVNKVLLRHRHALCIHLIYSCSPQQGEVEYCNRDHVARKAKNICCLALHRKCLPTPDPGFEMPKRCQTSHCTSGTWSWEIAFPRTHSQIELGPHPLTSWQGTTLSGPGVEQHLGA